MKINELAVATFKFAQCLESELDKESSMKYPKDLGSWGMEKARLDELRRFLSKLTVELKVFDIEEDEFPDLVSKDLVEVELRSSIKDTRKALDVLRRAKAFPIEKFHVVNLKKKLLKEEKLDSNDKDLTSKEVKNIVQECFTPNSGELEKYFSNLKGKQTYSDDEGTVFLEITGLVKKEWIDKYFGKDIEIEKIEKQLSTGYYGGPGQHFSHTSVSLKLKDKDDFEFSININSGLDI